MTVLVVSRLQQRLLPESASSSRDGVIKEDESVVAVLTGHLLKDTDYVMQYHSGTLKAPDGEEIRGSFGNLPVRVKASRDAIAKCCLGRES